MSNVNTILNERMKRDNRSSKMVALARQSSEGQLSGFSGIFSVSELSQGEKDYLETILREHASNRADVRNDLKNLISITSEVKAINNQAAILHGERIKKAQQILKGYRDGAFTAWLLTTYGNRQTPYNFLQYYELYEAIPKALRIHIEAMPKQAIYTLASREGSLEKKVDIIEGYQGQSKQELLALIRDAFPLKIKDKRRQNVGEGAIRELQRATHLLRKSRGKLSNVQKHAISDLLKEIMALIR